MNKNLKVFILSIVVFVFSGCSTWKTYDISYKESNGVAILNQKDFESNMFYIANVNGKTKGWGKLTKILFKPGVNLIGFSVNPFFYDLKPSDLKEKYNSLTDNIYYWVKFDANKNAQYYIEYNLTETDSDTANLLIQIINSENEKVSSTPIGNFVNIPNLKIKTIY